MDNNIEKIENEANEVENVVATASKSPKIKKRIALKTVTATFYSVITIFAFGLNIWLLIDAISLSNTVTEGWDGLGKAIGLAVLIYLAVIVGVSALVLYQLPFILSLTGLITSFKTKGGTIRKGKIFFSVLLALTVISEVLIAILSAAIPLIIKIKNG